MDILLKSICIVNNDLSDFQPDFLKVFRVFWLKKCKNGYFWLIRGGWKYHNIKISRHSLTILTQLWPWAHLPSFKVIGGVWLHTVHHPPPSSFYFWPKIQFSGKWWENGVVIAWSSSLSINIIATAPSDNIFVNKSGGGIEGLPMSRHKQGKMAKNV